MRLFSRKIAIKNYCILNVMLLGAPIVAQRVKNPARIHEDAGSIPGLTQWVKGSGIAVSCELWCRLQRRLGSGIAVAVA